MQACMYGGPLGFCAAQGWMLRNAGAISPSSSFLFVFSLRRGRMGTDGRRTDGAAERLGLAWHDLDELDELNDLNWMTWMT